jgi:hypothetical protein
MPQIKISLLFREKMHRNGKIVPSLALAFGEGAIVGIE